MITWPLAPSATSSWSFQARTSVSHPFGEELSHETLERLDQGAVGDVSSELIKLSREEVTATAGDRLMDFVDECRLADARITRHEHHFGCSRAGPFERLNERRNLRVASVELLRYLKLLGEVISAQV